MGYYNYHGINKRKIKEGKLIDYKIVENWNGIKPALVLFFVDIKPRPIRKKKWEEYFDLLK